MILSRTHWAMFMAAGGFGLFAVGDATGKLLSGELNAFQISFWYGVFSVLSLAIFSPFLGGIGRTLKTRKLKWHALRGFCTGLMPPLIYYGLAYMPMVTFYTLVFLAPLFTVILSMLVFGEHVTLKRWGLIAAGFIGVAIAMNPWEALSGANDLSLLPVLAILATAFIFAVRNLLVKKLGDDETMLSLSLFPSLGIIVLSAIPVFSDFTLPLWHELAALWLIGFTSASGLIILSLAFRMADSALVAPLHYTQLFWGAILGAILFGEWPDGWMIAGAVIVVGSGAVLLMDKKVNQTGTE